MCIFYKQQSQILGFIEGREIQPLLAERRKHWFQVDHTLRLAGSRNFYKRSLILSQGDFVKNTHSRARDLQPQNLLRTA